MRLSSTALSLAAAASLAACAADTTTPTGENLIENRTAVRVVNAFTSPVDILIDGTVAVSALPAGSIGKASYEAGNHTLQLRKTGTTTSISQSVTATYGAVNTIAAVRSSAGAMETAVLDDTNSVVPAGATKVRVLHMAPNAGVLQVFRTQPDYQTPISWQFPFTYQASPTSLSAPFYQSTPGTWEIRIWQTPADASGWGSAALKVILNLGSGEKRTIMILDAPGGGVRTEVL